MMGLALDSDPNSGVDRSKELEGRSFPPDPILTYQRIFDNIYF